MHLVRVGAVVSGLAAGLSAQNTILVGPGGYSQISAALAVAQPGDILLVAAGAYEPFTANLGVRILGTGSVSVFGNGPPFTSYQTNLSAPAGQTLYVSGLTFKSAGSTLGHSIFVSGGQVVLESCNFEGGHPSAVNQALSCATADAVLRRCTFTTAHRCLQLHSGTLAATDCRFLPYEYTLSIGAPLDGIKVTGGAATFSFCELRGATVNSSPGTGGSAVLVSGAGKLRLCDCQVNGGNSTTGLPVPAIVNSSGVPVEHSRSSVVGGFGWVLTGFSGWYQGGPSFVGLQVQRTLPGTVASPGGLQSGATFDFACTGAPGALVAVPLSFELSPPALVPMVLDPVRFDLATLVVPYVGVANSAGVYQAPAVAIPPALVGASAWFHPLLLDGASFLAGVPVGGVVR